MPPVALPGRVKVGFPAGKSDGDVIAKAIWTHFGTAGGASGGGWGGPVPARPFLANAMRDNNRAYHAQMKTAAVSIFEGRMTVDAALQRLGGLAGADVEESIVSLRTPPNSALTISLKGSDNPLVDTGEMQQSVRWDVE